MAKDANSTATVVVDKPTDSLDGEIVSIEPGKGVVIYYRITRTQRYENRFIPWSAVVGVSGAEGESGSVQFLVRSIELDLDVEGVMSSDEHSITFEGETTVVLNPANCDVEVSTEDTGKKKGKKGKEEKKKPKKEKGKRVGKRSKADDDEEDAEDEDDE